MGGVGGLSEQQCEHWLNKREEEGEGGRKEAVICQGGIRLCCHGQISTKETNYLGPVPTAATSRHPGRRPVFKRSCGMLWKVCVMVGLCIRNETSVELNNRISVHFRGGSSPEDETALACCVSVYILCLCVCWHIVKCCRFLFIDCCFGLVWVFFFLQILHTCFI